jgi:hypothetical protein
MHGLRLLGCRHLTGTDGPHRFVGDHRVGKRLLAAQREHRVELLGDDALGGARLALGELLTHAQNGREISGQRRAELARDQRAVLAEQRAPLGVANDDVVAADITQHRARHLAGVGAGRLDGEVLGTKTHRAALQHGRSLGQVRKRRAHRNGDV